jgi:hypothetical protein
MADETIVGTTAAGAALGSIGAAMLGAAASVGAVELVGTAGITADREG